MRRAREAIKGNIKAVSKNSDRTWELSGGIGVCSECGHRMVAHTTLNSVKKRYHYYLCSNRQRQSDNCSNRKHYRAGDLEMQVKDAIVNTFHPDRWADFVNDLCDSQILNLRKLNHSPHTSKEGLVKRIGDLESKLDRARNLHIDGDLSRPAYEEKKSIIQGEIEVIQEQLTKVDDLDVEISRVEGLRHALLSIEDPWSGHYAFIPDEDFHVNLVETEKNFKYGFAYGSKKLAAKRRQEFYRRAGIKVKVGEELEISMGLGETLVSENGCTSG